MLDEIRPIKVKLENTPNDIRIYALSDLHIGDPNCDIIKIKKVVENIKNDPQMYVVLMGDILNTALANSKSDIYSEVMGVSEAQKLAVSILEPIKDRILAMIPGNHENRVWRETGLDLSLWLAEKLGCEDRYRLNGFALYVEFGRTHQGKKYHLRIFGQHGSRGGRKLGGSMNALEELDEIISNADIYIMGHTHQNLQGGRATFTFNQYGNIEKQYKYYFNAPTFLRYGGYGYDRGYKPGDDSPCYLNVRAYGELERNSRNYHQRFKIDKVMM